MPAKGARTTGGAAKNAPTQSDTSRIQSTQAKSGNDTGKGSFPSRIQSAAAKAANAPKGTPKSTK
ncbi:hypothetical protein QCA50_017966 [Cerrena zonata]|uniref:SMP domain-containing protein n=1 Tax=Cerrena zonata TaxID=2478898 RepID=A0AAW0FI54_9APHY